MTKHFMFLGSLLNLITLVIGTVFGFIAGTMYSMRVHAQNKPQVEAVAPMISAGTAAFGTLLAGRFAADEVGTHGVDLLKLDMDILNVLGSSPLFTHDQLQKAIEDARTPTILQMKPPSTPAPTPNKPGGK